MRIVGGKKVTFIRRYDQESEEYFEEMPPPRYISRSTRYEVMQRQGWRCNNCGVRLKYSRDNPLGQELGHIDHIHPYADAEFYPRGISNINESRNLQALCKECNLGKGKRKQ